MADNLVARKAPEWRVIYKTPDVCKTPMGSATPPIPYPTTALLIQSTSVTKTVNSNSTPLTVFDASYMPTVIGDQAGVALGTGSSTVGKHCWPAQKSDSVKAESRLLVRHGDEFKMNGNFTGETAAAKAARFKCRQGQIAAGKASSDPKVREAASNFERNNVAVEKAKLAQDVYSDGKNPPTGWKNVSDDPEAMAKYGLKPDDMAIKDREFRAQVYEPDPAVFGDAMKPSVVFKGTTPTSTQDWVNNVQQGGNFHSPYYEQAVNIGTRVSNSGANVDMVGHSLGGGMASAASRASGTSGWTFNAAGLNSSTVTRYNGTLNTPAVENIMAYRVNGEFLTGIQEQGLKGTLGAAGVGLLGGPVGALIGAVGKVGLSAMLPNAVGTKFDLGGTGVNPVDRHGMAQVIPGIEAEKQKDQATISAATGKHCE
jgi:Domain of unknown function (DUF4150)